MVYYGAIPIMMVVTSNRCVLSIPSNINIQSICVIIASHVSWFLASTAIVYTPHPFNQSISTGYVSHLLLF